jgi:hypothetical protein
MNRISMGAGLAVAFYVDDEHAMTRTEVRSVISVLIQLMEELPS